MLLAQAFLRQTLFCRQLFCTQSLYALPLREVRTPEHDSRQPPPAYRIPGIGPYVSFVVDNVFVNTPKREFLHLWQMNDLCLKFVECALPAGR